MGAVALLTLATLSYEYYPPPPPPPQVRLLNVNNLAI